jgi:uncharacterized protein YndB with AHSA1/START domain
MIDVVEQVNAVARQVGSRVLQAGEARTVTITRTFGTDVEDLWDACTNASRIPRWLLPVSGELRLHGRYQLEGNAGGTIERCTAPVAFDATWEYGGEVSWIEVRLSAEPDGGSRLEIVHIAHVDARWAEFGPGAVGVGWDLMLMGLAGHVGAGQAIDPREAMAWLSSAEGTRFVSLSSRRWGEANVAAGADPGAALAAADRTTAAYTTPADSPAPDSAAT